MKFHFSFILSIIVCCNNSETLRKLTGQEHYELSYESINSGKIEDDIIYKDVNNNLFTLDSINKMRTDTIGFDYYVDNNNIIVEGIIRSKNEDDIVYEKKLDSLLRNNHAFLEKFVNYLNLNEEDKKATILMYSENKLPKGTYLIPCNRIGDFLNKALEKDQKARTNGYDFHNIDKANQLLFESIVEYCCIENIAEHGDEIVHAAFMIIQHAPLAIQEKYYPNFISWSKEGLLKASSLALMTDRMRLRNGQKQLFGSQISYNNDTGVAMVDPIEYPMRVNFRRDSVGLEPIEDYALRFGIIWSWEIKK